MDNVVDHNHTHRRDPHEDFAGDPAALAELLKMLLTLISRLPPEVEMARRHWLGASAERCSDEPHRNFP